MIGGTHENNSHKNKIEDSNNANDYEYLFTEN